MLGEACLPSNAYYARMPDYTLYSGVHVCWSEHSDLSVVYGLMSLDYGLDTMTATSFSEKHDNTLTFCKLDKNFSRQHLEFFFSGKKEFDTSCTVSQTVCMKCQMLNSTLHPPPPPNTHTTTTTHTA